MRRPTPERTPCPGCGEPIGDYQPRRRIAPDIGAQPMSRLRRGLPAATIETLWHTTRAKTDGVTAG